MKEKYSTWIKDWLSKNNPYGKCHETSAEMAETFDDLEIVKGHVQTDWGKRSHCWCVDPDGNIVDPTRSQFGFVSEYDPWKPGDEVRVGKCLNCGNEIWEAVQDLDKSPIRSVCGKKCEDEFEAYLNEEMEEMEQSYRKEPKLKIEYAIRCIDCEGIIFSRTVHDMRHCSCKAMAIDGGREDRGGRIYGSGSYQHVTFEIDATEKDLLNDWNHVLDKFGRYTKEEAKELNYQLVGEPQRL